MNRDVNVPERTFPITVVIPTYNRASALIRCLQHLEQQTRKDFDVIVVDDGSRDDTADRVREFQNQTSLTLKFSRQENGGPARARNIAISMVKSPVTLMIGDDIFASPEFIERHMKLHSDMNDPYLAGLGLTVWEEQTQKLTRFMRSLDDVQFEYPLLLAGQQPSWRQFYTSNISVKTELVRQNPFCEKFPAAAMEDIELGFRLSQKGPLRVVFLREALAYHFHPTTLNQACRRMIKVGWANHLFYELWPQNRNDPKGSTPLRRTLREFLIEEHVLKTVTWFASLLSDLYLPKPMLRAILNSYAYLGYMDREAEVAPSRARKPSATGQLSHRGGNEYPS